MKRLLLLAWAATAVWMGSPSRADSDKSWNAHLNEDPRLEVPITLYRERIPLGDLAKLLAKKTGASIRSSSTDLAMGTIELAVGSTQVPAWKLMDAVASLHLGSGARWGWRRRKSRQSLHPPLSSTDGAPGGVSASGAG
jgi:hypothetical protein